MEPDPSEWSGLPPALLALVAAERAAGNRVAAIERGFPAPPVGFCVLLERDVSTRPADADDGLHYRQWPNWKGYHGYSDEPGHFYVLNPLRLHQGPQGRRQARPFGGIRLHGQTGFRLSYRRRRRCGRGVPRCG